MPVGKQIATATTASRQEWTTTMATFYKSWRTHTALISKLMFTVKAGKPRGQIWVRDIHACPSDKMCEVSKFVFSVLRPILDECDWLPKDSEHLCKELKRWKDNPAVCVLKYDIKQLFMSGTEDELTDAATMNLWVNRLIAQALEAPLRFVIRHQIVQSEVLLLVFEMVTL